VPLDAIKRLGDKLGDVVSTQNGIAIEDMEWMGISWAVLKGTKGNYEKLVYGFAQQMLTAGILWASPKEFDDYLKPARAFVDMNRDLIAEIFLLEVP
jgi:hypothetical protein